MSSRISKLQPWYHKPLPRCVTVTLAKEQCIFSARYTDTKTGTIFLCKIHADIAEFPVKLIKATQIVIR